MKRMRRTEKKAKVVESILAGSPVRRTVMEMTSPYDEYLSFGFAVWTTPQDTIEENFYDRFERAPTDEDWETINSDISILERNTVKLLNKWFDSARDERHAGESLVGSARVSWDNRDALETVANAARGLGNETIRHYDLLPEDDAIVGEGTSDLGVVDVEISFFGIDEDNQARLREMFNWL